MCMCGLDVSSGTQALPRKLDSISDVISVVGEAVFSQMQLQLYSGREVAPQVETHSPAELQQYGRIQPFLL